MFRKLGTIDIDGLSGTGKSHFLHKLINEIISDEKDETKLFLFDPKTTEFTMYKKSVKTIALVQKELNDLKDDNLFKELHDRAANHKAGISNNDRPKLYLIFDDYAFTFMNSKDQGRSALKPFALNRAALNIELVFANQSTYKPVTFKNSVDTIINLSYSEQSSGHIFGRFGKYRDFRNTSVIGDPTKVDSFVSAYREEVAEAAEVTNIKISNDSKVLDVIDHEMKQRIVDPNLKDLPVKYVFVDLNSDKNEGGVRSFNSKLKRMLFFAHQSRVIFILSEYNKQTTSPGIKRLMDTEVIFRQPTK